MPRYIKDSTMSNYINGLKNGTRYRESGLVLGHTRDLRDRFLNGWFRWFFETNTQFENIIGQDHVNSRKQSFKSLDR
jgi:hypothetical protein